MSFFEILLPVFLIITISLVLYYLTRKKHSNKNNNANEYTKALNFMINGDIEEAIKTFTEYVKENTENIDAYIKLGVLYRRTDRADRAAKIHESLLHRQGINFDQKLLILRNLTEDYIEDKKKNEALTIAKSILEIDKKNRWALEIIYNLNKELHNWDEAAEYLKKLQNLSKIKDPRQLALLQVQKGLQKYEKGEYHEARLIFRKAIKIDSFCETPYYYIAESYRRDGRNEDAVKWWKKFTEAAPEKGYLIFETLKKVLFQLGKFSDIKIFYDDILKKIPTDVHTIIALSDFYENKGELEQAMFLLEELVEKNPNSRLAVIALSRILILNKKDIKADELLRDLRKKIDDSQVFICSDCNNETRDIHWICPVCGHNDTYFD